MEREYQIRKSKITVDCFVFRDELLNKVKELGAEVMCEGDTRLESELCAYIPALQSAFSFGAYNLLTIYGKEEKQFTKTKRRIEDKLNVQLKEYCKL